MTRILSRSAVLAGMVAVTLAIVASAEQLTDAERADGFVSIFDGKSLDGWQGAIEHWAAEDGKLIYRSLKPAHSSKDLLDLKLMTTREYSDSVLRFEFKLDKAANNGVAVRAPLDGDPAFVGMEIQVIDTPNWKNLKPWQVHGSIYGVVPAKTGHLKPAGEWNSEEILCQGRHVRVTLNDVVIVDTNLDEVGDKTQDGVAHPGLKRDKGYIGLLGHTRQAQFRNLRIKELAGDDRNPVKASATTADYFPPPESAGGWRMFDDPEDIRQIAGMDPAKLDALKEWLLKSDNRNFAAVVIRRGYIVLEVERGNSAKTDARRVASVSKAVCATVLGIAAERSRQGLTPKKMTFDDPAFDFIPQAQPLSDPRKAAITVKQLLNHTSGITPEATGARNQGPWQHVLGHDGDPLTAKLAFDPGTKCGYSSFALYHASLVCENVTGKPYDQFAIEALFKPIGVEHWTFEFFDGGGPDGDTRYGRHPSHGLGMPARDLARIAYCMLHNGHWQDKQVVPRWFVEETAAPTHNVKEPELRFNRAAESFSHGWELPSRLTDGRGDGIPQDARFKPGSGGQLIAFVPSLDLVITRQTGSSGSWEYEQYLRLACKAIAK